MPLLPVPLLPVPLPPMCRNRAPCSSPALQHSPKTLPQAPHPELPRQGGLQALPLRLLPLVSPRPCAPAAERLAHALCHAACSHAPAGFALSLHPHPPTHPLAHRRRPTARSSGAPRTTAGTAPACTTRTPSASGTRWTTAARSAQGERAPLAFPRTAQCSAPHNAIGRSATGHAVPGCAPLMGDGGAGSHRVRRTLLCWHSVVHGPVAVRLAAVHGALPGRQQAPP